MSRMKGTTSLRPKAGRLIKCQLTRKWLAVPLAFAMISVVTACATAQNAGTLAGSGATNTAIPTSSPSQVPTATTTSSPTATSTPTPELPSHGPYLIYTYSVAGSTVQIVETGAEGKGHAVINLPEGGYIRNIQDSLSPDGVWLAYFTGSDDEPYDLALHVMSLPDGSELHPIPLISASHEQQLSVIATALPTLIPGFEGNSADVPDWRGPIDSTFRTGIMSLAWSPVGDKLAFVAQIDGPSSDVYVLDANTGSLNRLSDDLLNSGYLSWSPDGRWVVYRNFVPDAVYDYNGFLFASRSDTNSPAHPASLYPAYWWTILGWISDEQVLITGSGDTGPYYNLFALNVRTRKKTILWPDVYEAFAIDRNRKEIALSAAPSAYDFADPSPHLGDGLYLISFDGRRRKISDAIYWVLDSIGESSARFVGHDGEEVLLVNDDGSTAPISDWPLAQLSASPDGAWFVLYADLGIELFDEKGQQAKILTQDPVSNVSWQPDSKGLFFTSRGQLFRASVPGGILTLVDDCDGGQCWIGSGMSTWRP
jgi:hypothetical protein